MNTIHRVIFNAHRGVMMVVNELTSVAQKNGAKTVVAASVAAALTVIAGAAAAEEQNNNSSINPNDYPIYSSLGLTASEAKTVKIGEALAGPSPDEAGIYVMTGKSGLGEFQSVQIGNIGSDTTKFKLFNGRLNIFAGGLYIAEGGKLGSNKGTIEINGGKSVINGTLAPTDVDGYVDANGELIATRNNSKAHTSIVLRSFNYDENNRSQAVLDIGKNGYVNIQYLTLQDDSVLTNRGYIGVARPAEAAVRKNVSRVTLIGSPNSRFVNYGNVRLGERTKNLNDGQKQFYGADAFEGLYHQFDGTTTLTGVNFFGGRTFIAGGTINALTATHSVDGTKLPETEAGLEGQSDGIPRIYMSGGTLNIKELQIDVPRTYVTPVKLFYDKASLNVDKLSLTKGTKIGINGGTLKIGEADIDGYIETTRINLQENGEIIPLENQPHAPAASTGTIEFTKTGNLGSTSSIKIGRIVVDSGATVNASGTIELQNGTSEIGGNFALAENAALQLRNGNTLTFTGGISTINGSINTLPDTEDVVYGGNLNVNGGSLTINSSGTVKVEKVLLDNGTLTVNNAVDSALLQMTGGTLVLNAGASFTAKDQQFNGGDLILAGSNEDVFKNANGEYITLGGANLKYGSEAKAVTNLVSAQGGGIAVTGAYKFDTATVAGDLNVAAGGRLEVNTFTTSDGSAEVASGGTLSAKTLNLSNTLRVAGTLETTTDQVFNKSAIDSTHESGTYVPAADETLSAKSDKLVFGDANVPSAVGKLVLSDNYNTKYALAAEKVYSNSIIVWNGTHVTLSEAVKVAIDDIANTSNSVFSDLDVQVSGSTSVEDNTQSVSIDKTFGASSIEVATTSSPAEKVVVTIGGDSSVTLVGNAETGGAEKKEVISGATSVAVSGTLKLGESGSSGNSGKITAEVQVTGDNAAIKVEAGNYELTDVKANQATVSVANSGSVTMETLAIENSGSLTVDNGTATVTTAEAKNSTVEVKSGTLEVSSLTLDGSKLTVSEGSANLGTVTLKADTVLDLKAADATQESVTKVSKLVVADSGEKGHTVTGALQAESLSVAENKTAVINIGTTGKTADGGKAGSLVLNSTASLKGLTFFLDPTWVDGMEVTDASRLILPNTSIDGNIVVGNNSYVVLGGTSDEEFVKLFAEDGPLAGQWRDGGTLAAVYVAQPVTIDGGYICVDQSLTSLSGLTEAPAAGSVTFGENALVVGDASAANGTALITASSFRVDENAKAVITNLDGVTEFKLTAYADGAVAGANDRLFAADQVEAASDLYGLTYDPATGKFVVTVQDAEEVYGKYMQGTALVNGASAAPEELRSYVNGLLEDVTGTKSIADISAYFDAAMNPVGSLAAFTTAYDRSSDLRRAVRAEAESAEGPRLWARATGGKTRLSGISTGGTALHTKTDAYGVIVGAEGDLADFTVGAAFSVGRGETKNDAVTAKDEFDWYGVSLYGKTTVGGVDILADASATFLKSDLTVGGAAAVDTDTTTAVWSIGAQVQKTFDVGVDVTPFIGMDIYHVRGDGYSNGHGASVQDSNATAVEFPIGATVAKTFESSTGAVISPSFALAVVPTVADREIDSKVKFAGAESTYSYTFTDDVRVRANLGFDVKKDNLQIGFAGGYEWGNEERSAATLQLRARYAF